MFDGNCNLNSTTDFDREKQRVDAWCKKFHDDWAYLDDVEPLPDNFEAICKGKERIPVYSK